VIPGTLRGQLLVATPPLVDPNFDRTVVLVLEHNDDGALGLVLNRPSDARLVDALPDWHTHGAEPGVVFLGGPVSTDAVIGMALVSGDDAEPESFTPLFLGLGTVDLSRDPADLEGLQMVRVFAGYSGWGSGQLEAEMEVGAWISLDAAVGDVFIGTPEQLWRTVLIRQGGQLALLGRLFPDDPALN
jgi:putative transcriptional regulator